MSKTFFISFSGSIGEPDLNLVARQKLLNQSAISACNADEEIAWTRDDFLESRFYKNNKKILDQTRGAGFWSWKPYLILKTLDMVAKNDWVVYSDIGKPYKRGDPARAGNFKIGNVMNTPFDALIDYADNNNGFTPGVWIPHYGSAKTWTKRDCFVGMDCDQPHYHNSGQVQAGYSCWSNTKASREFLTQWLKWCQVEAVISDQVNIYGKPNFNEFRDHRHDQSILTNLVIKNNIRLFGPKEHSLDGYRDFNLIIRHMALSKSLSKQSQRLSRLFKGPDAVFPTYLQQALNLWLLAGLASASKINIHKTDKLNFWQTIFSDHRVVVKQYKQSGQGSDEKYHAVFANDCSDKDSLIPILVKSYESLVPGGILLFGPYSGEKTQEAKLNGSFNEFLQWLSINQCFPPSTASKANQVRNVLTLGNSQNPTIISNEANKNYVILRKPNMDLSHS